MARSPVGMASAAALLLGGRRITSFDEPSAEAALCRDLYPLSVDELLSSHIWKFADVFVKLAPLAEPAEDFKYVYLRPIDALGIRSVGTSPDDKDQTAHYQVRGNRIYTDVENVVVRIIADIAPDLWPGYFQVAVIADLAASLAYPLTLDRDVAEYYALKAEKRFDRSKNTDAKQVPPSRLRGFPLTDVRVGG